MDHCAPPWVGRHSGFTSVIAMNANIVEADLSDQDVDALTTGNRIARSFQPGTTLPEALAHSFVCGRVSSYGVVSAC
jgi:hypothetical protein